MILNNSFYTVLGKRVAEGTITYDIALHSEHIIYAAHFPDKKVTPGVCLIAIGRELLEDHLHTPLSLVAAKNIKFLAVVAPETTPTIRYDITIPADDGTTLSVRLSVVAGDTVVARLSLTCCRR